MLGNIVYAVLTGDYDRCRAIAQLLRVTLRTCSHFETPGHTH